MNLASYIDHTLLKPEATQSQIEKLCQQAKEFHFATVCVNPFWVEFCANYLKGSDVGVCTVIGFPLGANLSATKAFEAQQAIIQGASEIDMVINIGLVKEKRFEEVEKDIKAVVEAAGGHCVKVILETCLLSDEEIVSACLACVNAKSTFVKTSTGFSTSGATVHHVELMKATVQNKLQVKASGGIRSLEDVTQMIEAGATRIGTSGGCQLVQGENGTNSY